MTIEHKSIDATTVKAAGDEGEWEAVIATLGVIDADGDVIEPGALGGQTVPIIPAHNSSAAPLGKASVSESGSRVIAQGRFNLDVAAAKDWFSAIKFDLEADPRMQYSWGFRIPKGGAKTEERDGQQVRVIEKVDLLEVSPVLRGASVGTRTISAKDQKEPLPLADQIEAVKADVEAVVARVLEVAESRKDRGRKLGKDTRILTVELAQQCSKMLDAVAAVVETEVLPDDLAAKAAARWLASEALRRGIEV